MRTHASPNGIAPDRLSSTIRVASAVETADPRPRARPLPRPPPRRYLGHEAGRASSAGTIDVPIARPGEAERTLTCTLSRSRLAAVGILSIMATAAAAPPEELARAFAPPDAF